MDVKLVNAELSKSKTAGVKRAGLLFTIAACRRRKILLKQHLSSVGQNTSPLTVKRYSAPRLKDSIMILRENMYQHRNGGCAVTR